MLKRTKHNSFGKRRQDGGSNPVHRRVTPAVLDKFSELWLQGTSVSAIARATGFNRKTVDHHIKHTLMPLWEREQVVKAEFELAKVEHVYAGAWKMFWKSTEPLPRQTVKDVLFENGVASGMIERVTTTVFRVGDPSWLKIVTWCLDFVAKVSGLYVQGRARAPSRTQPSQSGRQPDREMLLGGKPVEEFDEEALQVMLKGMDERRVHQESVRARQAEQEQQTDQDDRVELDEQDDREESDEQEDQADRDEEAEREGQEEENEEDGRAERTAASSSVGNGQELSCGRSAGCALYGANGGDLAAELV